MTQPANTSLRVPALSSLTSQAAFNNLGAGHSAMFRELTVLGVLLCLEILEMQQALSMTTPFSNIRLSPYACQYVQQHPSLTCTAPSCPLEVWWVATWLVCGSTTATSMKETATASSCALFFCLNCWPCGAASAGACCKVERLGPRAFEDGVRELTMAAMDDRVECCRTVCVPTADSSPAAGTGEPAQPYMVNAWSRQELCT